MSETYPYQILAELKFGAGNPSYASTQQEKYPDCALSVKHGFKPIGGLYELVGDDTE